MDILIRKSRATKPAQMHVILRDQSRSDAGAWLVSIDYRREWLSGEFGASLQSMTSVVFASRNKAEAEAELKAHE